MLFLRKVKRFIRLCSNPLCWNLVERTEVQLQKSVKGHSFCSSKCRNNWLIHENPNSSTDGRKRRSDYMLSDRNPMNNPESVAKLLGDLNPAKRPEVRAKISANNPMHRKEVRDKVTGIAKSEEEKKAASIRMKKWCAEHPEYRKGENNGMYGKHHTDLVKNLVSVTNKGKRCGPENPAWNDGSSFLPYCPKFTKEFRNRIRAFFNNICTICGKTEKENGKNLHCHHVTYNKLTCCDDSPVYFAALCNRCHGRTSHDRESWNYILRYIINEIYNGKSYYTKEEWKLIEVK